MLDLLGRSIGAARRQTLRRSLSARPVLQARHYLHRLALAARRTPVAVDSALAALCDAEVFEDEPQADVLGFQRRDLVAKPRFHVGELRRDPVLPVVERVDDRAQRVVTISRSSCAAGWPGRCVLADEAAGRLVSMSSISPGTMPRPSGFRRVERSTTAGRRGRAASLAPSAATSASEGLRLQHTGACGGPLVCDRLDIPPRQVGQRRRKLFLLKRRVLAGWTN